MKDIINVKKFIGGYKPAIDNFLCNEFARKLNHISSVKLSHLALFVHRDYGKIIQKFTNSRFMVLVFVLIVG